MNIGDKVRFLNTVGGGKITGFQGKDIVLVCDEDGFEIPTLRSEVVVIETDNYNFVRPESKEKNMPRKSADTRTGIKAALAEHHHSDDEEEEEQDPADREMTFRARPIERRGGDVLNLHIGFVPVDRKQISTTRFEAYLINDSNYYVRCLIFTQEGKLHRLRHDREIEPNQKVFLEELSHDDLPDIERLTVQVMAYKTEKAFCVKSPLDLTIRIDGTKFYKLHTFQTGDFFEEPALVIDLARNDQPARNVTVNAKDLEDALTTPRSAERKAAPARVEKGKTETKADDRNAIVEIDLHADAILDSTKGLEPKDIMTCQLKVFHDTMKKHAKDRGRRIVFIHGKGEGVLRTEILKELKKHYRQCTHQDASFREYGFGATMVTIR